MSCNISPPRYSWNIVESGIKHHNPNPCNISVILFTPRTYTSMVLIQSIMEVLSWSWSYGSWIYYYLCNQCLSPLTLWVQTPLRQGVLSATLCDKVCQWLVEGQWFCPGTPVSSINKTDHHDITEMLLNV